MGRMVVTEFISLDGVIEAPGGGEVTKLKKEQDGDIVVHGSALLVQGSAPTTNEEVCH